MARGATILQFEIELADVDRGVYQTLSLPVAQHPSENGPYLVARVLALCLEFEEGLVFTSGLSASQEPALWTRDLRGALRAWIEVGTPSGPRLHKASKAADRVAVYCHKSTGSWLKALARERVHAAEAIALWALPPDVVEQIAEELGRRNRWSLSRTEGVIYLDVGETTVEFVPGRLAWPGPPS